MNATFQVHANQASVGTAESAERKIRLAIRGDFRAELEKRLTCALGKPGSHQYESMTQALAGVLKPAESGEGPSIDLDLLSDKAKHDLNKLQGAAEGFEAIFVKNLFAQMQAASLSGESSPMGDMAKDMLNQTMAESAAKGSAPLGIAKTVFLSVADQAVRQSLAESRSADEPVTRGKTENGTHD